MKVKRHVLLKNRIIPVVYKGNLLDEEVCASLMSDKQLIGKRGQINGLVYAATQMPGKLNNKGWDHVIRNPVENLGKEGLAYDIKTPEGNIKVQYLRGEVPTSISKSVKHFMENHTPTRSTQGESGVMVAAGMRVDTTSSSRIMYVPSKNNNNVTRGRSTLLLRDAARDFNELLTKTICKEVMLRDLKTLKNINNVMVFPTNDNSSTVTVHPTYAISHNLTNSIHCDVNDSSRSFAVFYPSQSEKSCTWLLFPVYNIAIQCAASVVISWDGRTMEHCSCSEYGEVWSFFCSSNRNVSRHCNIERAFQKKKYNRVEVGDLVYTRERLGKMKNIHYADPNAKKYPKKWMYRKAKIVKYCKNNNAITVVFLAKLKSLSSVNYDINHVCRVDMVDINS